MNERLPGWLKIWWIALLAKTLFALFLPLANDEAYYWVWGHHPQLSYFDHPPMIGWLFSLGSAFETFGHGARLPAVWLAHASLLIWRRILARFLTDKQISFWLLFLLFSPFLGIGSLIATPDIPLLFFWPLGIWVLLRLLEKPSPFLYSALGAALGLGFCGKYMVVLFVPSALLWLAWSGQWRAIRWAYVPLTILTGLLFCAPVLVWNAQHDWASFAFQLHHGLGGEKKNPLWPLEYLLGQMGLLFPFALYWILRKPRREDLSFLQFFGWVPLIFFFYTSFRARVEANWPEMAHPALLSLAVVNAGSHIRLLKATLIIWACALLLLVSQVIYPWFPIDPKKLKTSEFTRFDAVAEWARDFKAPLYLGSYQMAGAVSYKLRRQIYKLNGMNRRDFYDFVPQSIPKDDRFFVCVETGHPFPPWLNEGAGYKAELAQKLGDEFSVYEVTRGEKNSDR